MRRKGLVLFLVLGHDYRLFGKRYWFHGLGFGFVKDVE